ncbi:hypothetical protein LSH36_110g01030 [Paralvinella palmiformis]|uniref:Phytanoyl-CoA hydroxylase-interacting protein-like C-terminal domain-containing protein n=1 Tax=Paralvinella palmiformis TaxID=53620 RepID=A0AAD9NC30_9ANNE|nr:hypothetical protein LSH36_110g01030 [Paralvinella palmiformis]
MTRNTKDLHGDPRSPINGHLNGLFFNIRVDPETYQLPTCSLFGERRLMIPVEHLIKSTSNIYFTDFYCINRCHYITLVIANPGSPADTFCRKNLLKIEKQNNCFLQVSYPGQGGPCSIHVPSRPIVEVFYTENIDIKSEVQTGALFTYVNMIGQRLGGKTGLIKKHLL